MILFSLSSSRTYDEWRIYFLGNISTKIEEEWSGVEASVGRLYHLVFSPPRLCALTRWPLREVSYTGCRCGEFTNKQGPVPFHWTDLLGATGDRPSYRRRKERKGTTHRRKNSCGHARLEFKIIAFERKTEERIKIAQNTRCSFFDLQQNGIREEKRYYTNPWISRWSCTTTERSREEQKHIIMAPMANTWYRIKYHGHVYTRGGEGFRLFVVWSRNLRLSSWNTGGIRRSGR